MIDTAALALDGSLKPAIPDLFPLRIRSVTMDFVVSPREPFRMYRPPMIVCLGASLASVALPCATATTPPSPASVATLPTVVVSGAQPGPGLWKVARDGHMMWVLGVTSPLPKRMRWQSREVEKAIAGSQQLLRSPTVKLKTVMGFFGKLFLLPSLYRARKIPDGGTLQQRVSADDYARWLVLKQKYIGHDRGVERWRPIFAALQLTRKALKRHDLGMDGGIEKSVERMARQHGVAVTPVKWMLVLNHPRAAIKTFTRSGLDGTACFDRTVHTLETQLPKMATRANVWATGDIDRLRRMPASPTLNACVTALTRTGLAQQLRMDELGSRIESIWLAAVDRSMRDQRQTFAVMPMHLLLKRGGALDDLQALGYTVQSPNETDESDSPSR